MTLYGRVRGLPLVVESYDLEPLEREVARGFTLRRTEVVLRGGGHEGRGEEVDYDPDAQQRFQERRAELPLVGEHTLDSYSLLQSGQTEYRRWALESAALDLALRQAGLSLAEALGRQQRPLRFVVSTRVTNVEPWLELYPELQFKLDPDKDWTDDVVSRVAGTGRVADARLQRRLPRRVRIAAGAAAVPADRHRVSGRLARGPGAHARDDGGAHRRP